MRSLLFVLLIAACAPATRPGTVNVASVRSEINGTIRSSENDRTIHSMGKVTPERAVVYTTSKDGATTILLSPDNAYLKEFKGGRGN